jgi:transcriptional regulator GlxA family with amidase domain
MNLRGLLVIAACAVSVLGIGTVGAAVLWPELGPGTWGSGFAGHSDVQAGARPEPATPSHRPGAGESINVAFVLTQGSTMIDFAGPWEVFQDVMLTEGGRMHHPFRLYTVSDSKTPIRASGGMQIVPDYTFADAPSPKIVVIPAQAGAPQLGDWLRSTRRTADVVMSVCTGAFHLGAAGLLDGKAATTHHDFFDRFASRFPNVKLQRGLRFVKTDDVVYTAGGLSSGIDLALHIVEKYYGRAVAEQTAFYMEYQGQGWKEVQVRTSK